LQLEKRLFRLSAILSPRNVEPRMSHLWELPSKWADPHALISLPFLCLLHPAIRHTTSLMVLQECVTTHPTVKNLWIATLHKPHILLCFSFLFCALFCTVFAMLEYLWAFSSIKKSPQLIYPLSLSINPFDQTQFTFRHLPLLQSSCSTVTMDALIRYWNRFFGLLQCRIFSIVGWKKNTEGSQSKDFSSGIVFTLHQKGIPCMKGHLKVWWLFYNVGKKACSDNWRN